MPAWSVLRHGGHDEKNMAFCGSNNHPSCIYYSLWSSGAVEQVSREQSGKVVPKRAKTSGTMVVPNQYENIQLTSYFPGLLILNKDNDNYRYKTRILCCLFYNA
jgi:hypothetical protein